MVMNLDGTLQSALRDLAFEMPNTVAELVPAAGVDAWYMKRELVLREIVRVEETRWRPWYLTC